MRIIGISGSPRGKRSTTRRLVERVLEGAQAEGADVELVDLSDVNIGYCVGCDLCHIKGPCSRKDDFGAIRERMLESDGLVLGSPLYFNSVSAQLKTAIDRLPQVIHCQQMLGKYACSVASAGAPEWNLATDFMNDILMRLGCTVVGSAGATPAIPGSMESAEQSSLALGHDLAQAIREQRTYPEQEAVHADMQERFRQLITRCKDHWPYEYAYFQEHGWL